MTDLIVIVSGGRDYMGHKQVFDALDRCSPDIVVQGGCRTGADAFARDWAIRNGAQVVTFHANWKVLGSKAGPIRNRMMARFSGASRALIFPGGRGTASCERECRLTDDMDVEMIGDA